MSDTDRAAAQADVRRYWQRAALAADRVPDRAPADTPTNLELYAVWKAAPSHAAFDEVARHVLRDPHKWRALLDVPYPDAPSTSTANRAEWRMARFGDGDE